MTDLENLNIYANKLETEIANWRRQCHDRDDIIDKHVKLEHSLRAEISVMKINIEIKDAKIKELEEEVKGDNEQLEQRSLTILELVNECNAKRQTINELESNHETSIQTYADLLTNSIREIATLQDTIKEQAERIEELEFHYKQIYELYNEK